MPCELVVILYLYAQYTDSIHTLLSFGKTPRIHYSQFAKAVCELICVIRIVHVWGHYGLTTQLGLTDAYPNTAETAIHIRQTSCSLIIVQKLQKHIRLIIAQVE